MCVVVAARARRPDGAEAGATAPGRHVLSAGIVSAGPREPWIQTPRAGSFNRASAGSCGALHSLCSRRGPREAAQKAAQKMAQVAPEVVVAGQVVGPPVVAAQVVTPQAAVPDRGAGDQSGKPGLMALAAAIAIPDSAPGELYMKQRIQWLETLTAGMYENMNIYDVHSKPPETKSGRRGSFLAETKVAQVLGHSTECERQCCAPAHSLMLHVNDKDGNTMVTIQRPGWGTGKYCLNHGACMDCCRDEIIVHEGRVDAEADACLCCSCCPCCDGCGQRVVNPNPISKARVPYLGGGCAPQIDVYEDHDSARPNGRVTGPCCFGGCSEFCCESKFMYKTLDGRDVSRIRKLVPTNCCDCLKELCTDADNYKLEFYEGSTNEEKANTIGLALLTDYMFFERDLGVCTCGQTNDGNPYIMFTLCLTFIYGCICPCNATVVFPVKEALRAAAGGGPDAPDAAEPEDPWLRNYLRNRKMHHRK